MVRVRTIQQIGVEVVQEVLVAEEPLAEVVLSIS